MKQILAAIFPIWLTLGIVSAQSADNPHEMPMDSMHSLQTQTSPSGVSDADAKEIVVARVNSTPVTLYAVRVLFERTGGASTPGVDATIQASLDRAIFEEMVYQKGIAEGLAPDPVEIDSKIKTLKEKMGQEAFDAALAERKDTETEWRAAYIRRLVIDKMLINEVSDVTVSDEALAKQYETDKASFLRREKVEVADIVFFLKMDDPASTAEAEKMLLKVRDGEDKDPHHLVPDGTFLVHDTELSPERQPMLYAEAKKLQTGQYSGVIHAQDALHIIRLKEYVSEKQFTLEEVKPLLKSKVMNEQRKQKVQAFEAELKKQYKIETTPVKEWKDKL